MSGLKARFGDTAGKRLSVWRYGLVVQIFLARDTVRLRIPTTRNTTERAQDPTHPDAQSYSPPHRLKSLRHTATIGSRRNYYYGPPSTDPGTSLHHHPYLRTAGFALHLKKRPVPPRICPATGKDNRQLQYNERIRNTTFRRTSNFEENQTHAPDIELKCMRSNSGKKLE